MNMHLRVPDDLEEQDIGQYYYHSRRSSLSISDSTDVSLSATVSRPTSHSRVHALKSPSLSHVAEVQQDRRPAVPRSKTVPDLPSTIASFAFSEDKLQRMRQWVLAFVVVHFDLDLGPVVRAIHPPIYLSPAEKENIAFSSFPDSLQFEQGSEVHSFRIRIYSTSFEEPRPPPLDGFIYGFSHFYQKRDPSSKRGYQQSSVVLLTYHQYPALYTSMISKLGPLFHDHGVPMLETACHNIATRQSPSPGSTVELGFLGSVLHVALPLDSDSQQLVETSMFEERFDPSLHLLASSAPFDPPPIRLFEASLSHLWSLWECLVLCEPILVYGPSPSMTSQAIWWLRDLLRPIPLAADVRPYFTIHDKDHASLVNKASPKAGLVLGVTNPFFERSCAHWPHVLSVGRSQLPKTVVTGPSPGWTTKTHRRYVSKDRQLLRSLEKACSGHAAQQKKEMQASLDVRRHFCARTSAMLAPLHRYLHMLVPSAPETRLKPFSTSDFLASLKKSPSALPFKSTSKQREFYERWLRTPAFGLWLACQEGGTC